MLFRGVPLYLSNNSTKPEQTVFDVLLKAFSLRSYVQRIRSASTTSKSVLTTLVVGVGMLMVVIVVVVGAAICFLFPTPYLYTC